MKDIRLIMFIVYGNFIDDWNVFGVCDTLQEAKQSCMKIKDWYWRESICVNECKINETYHDHNVMINHYYFDPNTNELILSND